MTEKTILFRGGNAAAYEENGNYYDTEGMAFMVGYDGNYIEFGLLQFTEDSDTGMIDGEPLDILLQCLEHRLATRNLAEPVLERTNAWSACGICDGGSVNWKIAKRLTEIGPRHDQSHPKL